MSNLSVNKNNQAIANIKLAIKKYEGAISKISKKNANERSNEIITLIKSCISELNGLSSKIEAINTQINRELRRVAEEEKEKSEGESSDS